MRPAFIREGDTTDHGGRVLAGTSTNIVFGKPPSKATWWRV